MLIRPVLTYACTVWGGASKSSLKKLQVIQNKTLRNIVDAPMYTKNSLIHKELKIESLTDYIKVTAKNFYDSTAESDHELIKNLGSYAYDPRDKYPRPNYFLHE
ncbi:hypothetical protein QAD02_009035 [Eretmocerus hayati]|uniref:Uncharacterized protein n=1 Tax=Eretmocerus hayati TaxID=131215 RepID=A0ACC2N8E0_9HYME|nr:hypothetical protein QAD02_009035 [Eretmocerus hayati]